MSTSPRSVWFSFLAACYLTLTPGCLGGSDHNGSGGGGDRDVGADSEQDMSTPDSGTCTESQMTASGWIRTSLTDFDASTANVYVTAHHRVEADIEDGGGCLVDLNVGLRLGTEGCYLSFYFGPVYDQAQGILTDHGALVDPYFEADSYCPGVSDEVEGAYRIDTSSYYIGMWFSGLTRLPDNASSQSCATNVRIEFPDKWILLDNTYPSERAPVSVNLGELILEGEVYSEGSTDWECLQTTGGCASGDVETESGMCSIE